MPAKAEIDHELAFKAMKALAGTYLETGPATEAATVEYKLISKDSALMEFWNMASGKTELSVFHMDNGVLVATHYCGADIQSTMTLSDIADDGELEFRIRSAANLSSNDNAHNSGFGYRFDGTQNIYRSEIWTEAGEESISHVELVRQ